MFKKECKKYFIKDESLHSVDGDMFNYSDIAQVLDDIISTNTPPYNVAVIGKWGLGKSSLINLVIGRYRKKGQYYQVQEINAWKYEKESLRKVFLKQLWQGVSNQRIQTFETVKKEMANIINAELPKETPYKDKGRTRRFCLTLSILLLISVFAFVVYKIVQACSAGTSIWTWAFWTHVFLRYCKNVSTVLIGPILVALCKLLIDDYHAKQSKKIELNFPIETTDDYEIFLETNIKKQLQKNPELRIITVIDDLDRLSIDKIVEALDALKAFVGFERCIFIVPFDDEIIKCALEKRRMKEFNDRTEVTDVIESELILDKLFQFKIYLPPILDFDIQQYAYKLVKQEVPDFLSEYCNESTMKKVIERVLIYPGVTTPRQVKKLLNAFINNLMIVSARETSGKIQRGLLTSEEGIMQIAKISVLQADFNNFYDLLFKDMRCMELILSAHRGEKSLGDLPSSLRSYFDKIEETIKLKNEHETLLNFLHRTAKYHVDNMAPYLYLAQDEISVKTGDELQRRAVNALKSSNPQTLKDLLAESEDLVDSILYHLSRENEEIEDMLWVTMMVYEDVASAYKQKLAQCIIEKNIELSFEESEFLYHIHPETVFAVASLGENEEFNHLFKERYLSVISNEIWFNREELREAMPVIFENLDSLSNSAKQNLKRICSFCVEKDDMDAVSLFDVVVPEKPEFIEYWGIKWFEKLCAYMEEENDFSDLASEQLYNAFNVLRESTLIDNLIELMLPLTQYDAFLSIIDGIISQKCEEESSECIKNLIGKKVATQLLQNIIEHDFDKNEEVICRIVEGLNYIITEDNAGVMDEFTLNYVSSFALDNILVHCGEQGYFELLPKTINSISESIFNDGNNDKLLGKTAYYFTDSQIETLGKKLLAGCTYSNGKDYERELSIIKTLSIITVFKDVFEKIADSKIVSSFSSYYNNANYREFTSAAMGLMKDNLSQQCIDKYIGALIYRYNGYHKFVLEAINRVTMAMSSVAFKTAFETIVTQSEMVDFELAFEVIRNHNDIRPCDQENLNRYASFLIKNLAMAEEPDCVLRTICRSFTSISNIQDMAINAQKNPECTEKELAKALAHFADRKDAVENVSSMFKMLCEAEISNKVLYEAISRVKEYSKEDIYAQFINELSGINSPRTLTSFVNIACHDLNIESACKLVINCLQKSFEKVDFVDCSLAIMDNIKADASSFKMYKAELATVLREGFSLTTSEHLKQAILLVVSNFKIKPQFKKTLTEEELNYYKKWTS